MKSITCNKKQMTQYHLYNAMCFEGTGHFRPIDLSSQCDASTEQAAVTGSSAKASGHHLPEDAPLPPYQGYAYAHRSLFWQFRLKVNNFAASVLPRLGVRGWCYECTAPVLAFPGVGEKSFRFFGKWNEKRTLRSNRLRLLLLSGLFFFGAHALSRAPISALSGEVC